MAFEQSTYRTALWDFRSARQQAALQEIVARLTGRSNRLLSYEEVAQKLRLTGRTDRGVQQIPLKAIVGSVGRYTDFTRSFLPRQDNAGERWARVKVATAEAGMPPIEVYKVGEVFFVLDGNHRVSIARQEGMTHIEAYVVEVQSKIPLTPDVQPDDLIVKAEYADFLEQTRLADLRPNVKIILTAPGQYARLKEQIDVQRYLMGMEREGPVPYEEAVVAWYDEVYLPTVTAIQDRGLLRWFPKRTEADLFMWVSEHHAALEKELGWEVRPEAVVTDLAVKESSRAEDREETPGSWRQEKMIDRYTEHLFLDILVPLEGTPKCWRALEQAVVLARREGAQLHGLHVVESEAQKESPEALAIQARFSQVCAAGGVPGSLVIEAGKVVDRICGRALLTDLVVLNADHPPAEGLPSLGSGLRSLVRRCARPLLAVPSCDCEVSPLDRALLAFDGSPKSREALFVAAYLAEQWKTSLTVVTVVGGRVQPSVQDYARAYLELHELQADYRLERGPLDVLHKIMDEGDMNLLLMGGYSTSALEQVMLGSLVNFMLRQKHSAIFVCR